MGRGDNKKIQGYKDHSLECNSYKANATHIKNEHWFFVKWKGIVSIT